MLGISLELYKVSLPWCQRSNLTLASTLPTNDRWVCCRKILVHGTTYFVGKLGGQSTLWIKLLLPCR